MKILALLLGSFISLTAHASETKDINMESYAAGVKMGEFGKKTIDYATKEGFELDIESYLMGYRDVLLNQVKLSNQEKEILIKKLDEKMKALKEKRENNLSNKNKKFLKENSKKENVFVTKTGLQYQILNEGYGNKPNISSIVEVHYKGTLIDGTVFDSSYDRNSPSSFSLNQVIKGWSEGLQLMTVGSKYKFYIPSELAYGTRSSATIPANSTLIFEVELLKIK